jgi:hypothetical protein
MTQISSVFPASKLLKPAVNFNPLLQGSMPDCSALEAEAQELQASILEKESAQVQCYLANPRDPMVLIYHNELVLMRLRLDAITIELENCPKGNPQPPPVAGPERKVIPFKIKKPGPGTEMVRLPRGPIPGFKPLPQPAPNYPIVSIRAPQPGVRYTPIEAPFGERLRLALRRFFNNPKPVINPENPVVETVAGVIGAIPMVVIAILSLPAEITASGLFAAGATAAAVAQPSKRTGEEKEVFFNGKRLTPTNGTVKVTTKEGVSGYFSVYAGKEGPYIVTKFTAEDLKKLQNTNLTLASDITTYDGKQTLHRGAKIVIANLTTGTEIR